MVAFRVVTAHFIMILSGNFDRTVETLILMKILLNNLTKLFLISMKLVTENFFTIAACYTGSCFKSTNFFTKLLILMKLVIADFYAIVGLALH